MNLFQLLSVAAALAVSSSMAPLASAADAMHDHGHGMEMHGAGMKGTKAATEGEMSEGEIKKVDKGAGKITIRHGELKNLSMPGMTMAFRTKDPAMLDQVKPGDKVRFVAEKDGGQLMVTRMALQK